MSILQQKVDKTIMRMLTADSQNIQMSNMIKKTR